MLIVAQVNSKVQVFLDMTQTIILMHVALGKQKLRIMHPFPQNQQNMGNTVQISIQISLAERKMRKIS